MPRSPVLAKVLAVRGRQEKGAPAAARARQQRRKNAVYRMTERALQAGLAQALHPSAQPIPGPQRTARAHQRAHELGAPAASPDPNTLTYLNTPHAPQRPVPQCPGIGRATKPYVKPYCCPADALLAPAPPVTRRAPRASGLRSSDGTAAMELRYPMAYLHAATTSYCLF